MAVVYRCHYAHGQNPCKPNGFSSTDTEAEMPTSGDLKSGDCLVFSARNETLPPPRKIDPAPNGNDLGHYMTSYMIDILSKFEMLEIIFVND